MFGDELKRVEKLRVDLGAEVIVADGQGHYETVTEYEEEIYQGSRYGTSYMSRDVPVEREVWVEDPPLMAPDVQTRETARAELQRIFDSSPWYSARYAAASALGDIKLDDSLNLGLAALEKGVNTQKEVTRRGGMVEQYDPRKGYYGGSYMVYDSDYVTTSLEPDEETRLKAICDASELLRLSHYPPIRKLIKRAYRGNELLSVRRAAGKALGYSSFRIWLSIKVYH